MLATAQQLLTDLAETWVSEDDTAEMFNQHDVNDCALCGPALDCPMHDNDDGFGGEN